MASTSGIKAGRAYVELGVNDTLTKGLKAAQAKLRAFGSAVSGIGKSFAAMGAAAFAPLAASVKMFASFGDNLAKSATRVGASTEAMSELAVAADLSGTSLETVERGMKKMQKTVTEAASGSKSAADALAGLGLTADQLAGKSPDQQMEIIADAIAAIEDPAQRTTAAMAVLGKSGSELIPMLAGGGKGLRDMRKQAADLGLTMSTETGKSAEALNDAMGLMLMVLKNTAVVIGGALAPAFTSAFTIITNVMVTVNQFIQRNGKLITIIAAVAGGILAFGTGLMSLGFAATAVAAGLGTVISIIGALASPMLIVIAAVGSLGVAFVTNTGIIGESIKWLNDQFGWLLDGVTQVVSAIASRLMSGDIEGAADILWRGLQVVWEWGIGQLGLLWLRLEKMGVSVLASLGEMLSGPMKSIVESFGLNWENTVKWMHETFFNFVAAMKLVWTSVTSWLTKRWLDLMRLFRQLTEEQVAQAKAMVDDELQIKIADIEAKRQADIEGPDIIDRLRARADEIDRLLQEGVSSESRAALESAKKALMDAMASTVGGEKRPSRANRFQDISLGAQQAEADNQQRISVSGGTNAAALAQLGAGGTFDRMVRATEATERHTKKIAQQAQLDNSLFGD